MTSMKRATVGSSMNADNLTVVNQQIVPEPITLAVFGGLVSIGGFIARRRRTIPTTL